MKTHTPGPWKVDKSFTPSAGCVTQKVIPISWSSVPCGSCGKSDGSWLIGWLFSQSLPRDQQEANARLIAAAPELLEALEACLNIVDGDGNIPDWNSVRAVVAKAKGVK